MKSNKHIILLTPGFAENESDENCIPPIQSFIKTSAEFYPENSFSVICFQYPFTKKPYKWYNVDVYPAGGKGAKGFKRILTWIRVLLYFLKIRSQHKNSTLHALWLTECYFIGLVFSKLFNIKLVATVMGQDAKKENRYMKVLSKFKADIICCSEFAAHTLKQAHGVSCQEVIPFGVYEKEYTFDAPSKRKIDIIGVGNLGPIKRYDLFVKLVAEIKKQLPDVYCEIIGEGEYRKNLEEQIIKEGLLDTIKLTGSLKRKEVLTKMKEAKILLHTSAYEGQGYVYMEALASGAYVVSFDTGFVPVHSKTKICKSEQEIVNGIQNILSGVLNFTPVILVTMKDTVTRYQKYYGK
jgi:glycosyltransferase involved in cell wall biosynthesis